MIQKTRISTEHEGPAPGLLTGDGAPIPLLGVRIEGKLEGLVLACTVAQRFRNEEKQPIEAVYLFPLPEDAAICGLRIRIGEREIRGVVEEREKAFERYDQAMAEGHGAYLLDEERPNVFQLSVGNLMPGQEALVEVRLLLSARPDEKGVRLMIPTTISPRYTPAATSAEERAEIERITPPYAVEVPYGLSFSLAAEMPSPVRAVESPSHTLRVELDGPKAKVSFARGEAALDRDIVLVLETAEPRAAGALAVLFQEREHVLCELYPDLGTSGRTLPRRVTFLVDCSGSMSGDSIAQARRAVELCLRALVAGDRFQIVCFGSSFHAMFPEPLAYTEQTLQSAVELVRRIDADLGGTEILAPLQQLLGSAGKGEERLDIIVLTDGEVSNEDQVLALAGKYRGRCRIFSFGIGAGASEFLVRGLARQSGGEAEFIFPGERIEPKVLRQFGRIDTPLLTGVTLDWGGQQVEQAPLHVPPLFAGNALLAAARLPQGVRLAERATITLQATTPDGPRSWSATVRRVEQGEPVALWWARQAIRDLEEGEGSVLVRRGSNQRRGGAAATPPPESALVRLSRSYGLLCRETSFVAVEERAVGERASTPAELRRVPVQLTVGWHGLGSVDRRAGKQMLFDRTCAGVMSAIAPPPPCCAPAQAGPYRSMPRSPAPQPAASRRSRAPVAPSARADAAAPFAGGVAGLFESVASFFDGKRKQKAEAFVEEVECAPAAPLEDLDMLDAAGAEGAAARGDADDEPWYLAVLLLARADGSFPCNEALARAVGLPLARLRQWAAELQAPDGVDREAILATALALVLLRTRAADEEPVWRLAAAKATSWLAGQQARGKQGADLQRWVEEQLGRV